MSIQTPIGLLSFPHLFVPRPPAQGAEPRFSCALLFDATAQKDPKFLALRKGVAAAIEDKWPGKARDPAFIARLRSPFRKTAEKDYQGYKDMIGGVYIQPWSKDRPGVVDARVQDITVPADVWSGQMARATVKPFAYDTSGNMGVAFNLNHVQICRTDGLRLDGRTTAAQDFETYGEVEDLAMADDSEPPFFLMPALIGGRPWLSAL